MTRKTAVIFLIISLLLTAMPVLAEGNGLPYLETVNQDAYINTTLLTDTSYPQVCISPYADYQLFQYHADPWYVVFPGPEGAKCSEFDVQSCYFLDFENDRQYSYQAIEDYSYESFLNKCEDESNIILDDSGAKAAAYIEPDNGRCRALLGLDGIKRGAKLYIIIKLENYKKIDASKRAQALTDTIMEEISRVQGSMAFVQNQNFWTYGNYRGVKLASYSVPGLTLKIDLPEFTYHFDNDQLTARSFPCLIDGQRAYFYAMDQSNKVVKLEAEIQESYSYAFRQEESEITRATLADGNEWGFYVSNEREGKPYSIYFSTLINDKDRYNYDTPVYLNFNLTVKEGQMAWTNLDAFIKDINAFVKNIQIERAE